MEELKKALFNMNVAITEELSGDIKKKFEDLYIAILDGLIKRDKEEMELLHGKME